MKQLIFILLVSCVIGAAAFYAGYHSAPVCEEADYKFYDTAIDENGDQVQLYVKQRPTGARFLCCNQPYVKR